MSPLDKDLSLFEKRVQSHRLHYFLYSHKGQRFQSIWSIWAKDLTQSFVVKRSFNLIIGFLKSVLKMIMFSFFQWTSCILMLNNNLFIDVAYFPIKSRLNWAYYGTNRHHINAISSQFSKHLKIELRSGNSK